MDDRKTERDCFCTACGSWCRWFEMVSEDICEWCDDWANQHEEQRRREELN